MEYRDWLTGRVLVLPDDPKDVCRHLADKIGELPEDASQAAGRLAKFWAHEYYRLIFPLHWGLEEGTLEARLSPTEGRWRERFLAWARPPVLLEEGMLAGEWALEAALAFQLGADGEERELGRLAALVWPLREMLSMPATLRTRLEPYLGEIKAPQDFRASLVVVGAERIQRYIFEGPGLPEMRGASVLLEEATQKVRTLVEEQIGPEAVLRAAGSTVIFVATPEEAPRLAECCRRIFLEKTAAGLPITVGWAEATWSELHGRYSRVAGEAWGKRGADRQGRRQGQAGVLPFEVRCANCGTRSADSWVRKAGGDEPEAYCTPCEGKRQAGKDKQGKLFQLFQEANVTAENMDVGDKMAETLDMMLGDEAAPHRRLAAVWGDGNNFGALGQQDEMARIRHWSARVESASEAAAVAALARAVRDSAPGAACYPFEVLAVGGDDLGFLAEGRVAVRAAELFLRYTDWEMARAEGEGPSAGYCLGVAAANAHAPVRALREFAEEGLLRWAKDEVHRRKSPTGAVAFWTAADVGQLPMDTAADDLPGFFKPPLRSDVDVTLTWRPYYAVEMNELRQLAEFVVSRGLQGKLSRLVQAFHREPPRAAELFFLYQWSRAEGGGKELFERVEELGRKLQTRPEPKPPQKAGAVVAQPAGAVLVDLLELVKLEGGAGR